MIVWIIVQSVKHEDLRLDDQKPHKMQSMAMYTWNLVLMSLEKGEAHWPVSLAKTMSFKFNKISFLKK